MKKRMIYGAVSALLLVNLIVGAGTYFYTVQAAENESAYPSLELFTRVMELIRKDYVDAESLTYKDLINGALEGMVQKLDPHSEYLDPLEYKELQNDTEGSFGGIGIMVEQKDDWVTVVAPMEDTPGFKAGILAGDRIIRINGRSAERMPTTDVVKLLRGEPNTKVTLTILRPSTGVTKDFTLTRTEIKVDMVKDCNGKKEFPLGSDKIGYIRLTQFGDRTSTDLTDALSKLRGQGMQGLVLDLRWNPGGLLDEAVRVCEKFLPRGTLVVTTEGANSSQSSKRYARGRGDLIPGINMVVLVNHSSASAAEIVAGCLQDLNRAVILGERTFGKGSVQSILPLQGDSGPALRLTTAKYYTPSHKVIHTKGIEPNIVVPLTDEEEELVALQRRPGGLTGLDEEVRAHYSQVHDVQLERAVDLLKGIKLFSQLAPAEKPAEPEKKMASK
jgi:carboxyl-terminal processing protease